MRKQYFVYDVKLGAIDKNDGTRYSRQRSLTVIAESSDKMLAAVKRKLRNSKSEVEFIEAFDEEGSVDLIVK